jgi:D-3-phosphoglycerate dehydrogenase
VGERVLVGDPYYPLELVQELLGGTGVAVEAARPPWAGDDVVALLAGPDYPVGKAELERLPALRVVSTCSVGYDHLDVEAAAARGVWICNVPDYCIDEMADSTLALLAALLRGVVALDRSVRAGAWDYSAAGPLRRIRGTRLGVIGFGRIGRAVAERGRALEMDVWATDPYVPQQEIESTGVRYASLEELLRSCVAFTLHVPLSPQTTGLIGRDELELMPPGSVLVNTARAGLIDQDALLQALETGHLAGAALDVLPVEPPPDGAPQAPGLVVTPHAAFYSPEAEQAVLRRSILAVRDAVEGRVPADAITS